MSNRITPYLTKLDRADLPDLAGYSDAEQARKLDEIFAACLAHPGTAGSIGLRLVELVPEAAHGTADAEAHLWHDLNDGDGFLAGA